MGDEEIKERLNIGDEEERHIGWLWPTVWVGKKECRIEGKVKGWS